MDEELQKDLLAMPDVSQRTRRILLGDQKGVYFNLKNLLGDSKNVYTTAEQPQLSLDRSPLGYYPSNRSMTLDFCILVPNPNPKHHGLT